MNRAERRRQERRNAARGAGIARLGRMRWLHIAIIVVAAIAAFATSFDGVFVLDDLGHIVDTTRIDDLSSSFTGRRPVINFTLALNYAAGGLETGGYHVVNLVIHVLAALTLFGVVRRSLAVPAAPWLALSAALLWVVHPLQTQSVTYIIQRGESLMGLFYLLTLYTFIRGSTRTGEKAGAPWFVASVIACALGMACKEVMVTAPLMVLLYDVIFVGGSIGRALRQRWAVHVGLASTWSVLVLCGISSVFDTDSGAQVGFGFEGVTWIEYARTQPEIILHYLQLAVWPRHLCLDYMWPVQESWGVFAAAAIGLVVLGLATVVLLVRRQPLGYLGAWFFVILGPTSSVVPIRDLAFEHRMYLPLAAVVVAAVLGIDALARFVARQSGSDSMGRVVMATIVLLTTTAFAVRTAVRNGDYSSAIRTWQSVVELRPENDRAHQNLGSALLTERRIDEAAKHSRIAVELNPANSNAHINLGTVSLQRGAFDEAINHLETAIRIAPDNPVACNNLGSLYARRGDMARAYQYFSEAVRLDPGNASSHFSLGRVLQGRGDVAGALREYRAALEIDPTHEGAVARVTALSR